MSEMTNMNLRGRRGVSPRKLVSGADAERQRSEDGVMARALRIEYPGGDCQGMARMRSAASRNQNILQKETKHTKTGENFAKNAEFLEIALQVAAVKAPLAGWLRNPIQARVRGLPRHPGHRHRR